MQDVGLAFRDSQKQAFLDSEPSWSQRLGDGWKGVRFLGKGCFGIVGLWEYQGDPLKAPLITKVVVKQSTDEPMDDLNQVWGDKSAMDEGRILSTLSSLNSNHIIRQYGGNRVGDKFLEMGHVVRIFLEFCPGGNLDRYVAGVKQPPLPTLPELELWMIFQCLALGVAVMDRGTEDIDKPAWNGDPPDRPELCHFDLKPDNILLGYRDDKHERLPIVKIADFGEALWVASKNVQDNTYGSIVANRGNVQLSPPENTFKEAKNQETPSHGFQHYPISQPRKGTCSNIWQLGAIMNILLKGQKIDFNHESFNPSHRLDKGTIGLRVRYNHSIGLDEGACAYRYSSCLIQLVKDCLLREALERPTSIELVKRTTEGLRNTIRASRDPPAPSRLSSATNDIPTLKITDPEPPTDWTIDTSEFELDIRNKEILPQNAPFASIGRHGFLTPLRSILRPKTPGSRKSPSGLTTLQSTTATGSPAPKLPRKAPLYRGDEDDDFVKL